MFLDKQKFCRNPIAYAETGHFRRLWMWVIAALGVMTFQNAHAQLVGDSIPVTGEFRLTDTGGTPLDVVNPALLDPEGAEVYNVLQNHGFASMTYWGGLWDGNFGIRAYSDATPTIPTLYAYGQITTANSMRASYILNVQRALNETLYYNINPWMRLDQQGIPGTQFNALYYQTERKENNVDKRLAVTPTTNAISGHHFETSPAVIELQFYVGTPANNQIYTGTGAGSACASGGKTPVVVTGGGNLYIAALQGNDYQNPPTSESTIAVWHNTCCNNEYAVVRGFSDPSRQNYRITHSTFISYNHPDGTARTVKFADLLNGLSYVDVVAPPMEVTSVCIPLTDVQDRSCIVGYGDVYGETEITSTIWFQGTFGEVATSRNGAIDTVGNPASGEFVIPSLVPATFNGVRFQSVLDRPPTAAGYPNSGDGLARLYTHPSYDKDANGNPRTSAFTTQGYPTPPGPTVPNQCSIYSAPGTSPTPTLVQPAYVSGTVTMYDGGTFIDANAATPTRLLAAVDYYTENNKIQNGAWTYVTTYEALTPTSGDTGAFSYAEPIPDLDPITGQPYIDPNGNKTTGIYYYPVIRPNWTAPDGTWLPSYWRTRILVMQFKAGVATDPEGYISQTLHYIKQQPNATQTAPMLLDASPIFPGQTHANQNFDLCFGIVRLTIKDTGGGVAKMIYDPVISKDVAGAGFLVGDFEPLATGSPSKIGGPRIDIKGVNGTPVGVANAAQEGIIKMILPAGVYTGLNLGYKIVNGGSTTLPPFNVGAVGCGQTVEITPNLQITASAPPCVEQDNVGDFGVVGTVNSVPLGPGAEAVANAQIQSMWYTVENGPPIMLNPAIHRTDMPGAASWGLTPTYGFDAILPTECEIYHIKVSAQLVDGTIASSESITVYDDGQAPVLECEDVTLVDINLDGSEAGNLSNFISATDNCDINTQISYFGALGVYPLNSSTEVVATGKDSCGNAATCTFNVNVVPPPIPDVPTLPTVTGQCSASVASNPPTATDYLGNTIVGVPLGATTFNQQGVYTVNWQYTDGLNTSVVQTQQVIVDDTMAPVPSANPLPTVTSDCFYALAPPIAVDNCAGVVLGTTGSPNVLSQLGNYTVTWTFDDGLGNTTTQDQEISIVDCNDLDDCNGEEQCDGVNGCIPGTPVPLTECGICASLGDVNGDGLVNVADTNCLIQVALWNLKNPTDPPPTCVQPTIYYADLNCDGTWNVKDVQMSMVLVQLALSGTPLPFVVDNDGNGCPDTCHD